MLVAVGWMVVGGGGGWWWGGGGWVVVVWEVVGVGAVGWGFWGWGWFGGRWWWVMGVGGGCIRVNISSYWNKRDLNQLLPQNNKGLQGDFEHFEFFFISTIRNLNK